jgi:hypothetical protein
MSIKHKSENANKINKEQAYYAYSMFEENHQRDINLGFQNTS